MDDAVYDVTKRETFLNLADVWAKEIELYSTNHDCIKMLVGNKVDIVSSTSNTCNQANLNLVFTLQLSLQECERKVSREEGTALAKELKFLFHECSARTRENVKQCFEELALKVSNQILVISLFTFILVWKVNQV